MYRMITMHAHPRQTNGWMYEYPENSETILPNERIVR